MTHHDNTGFLDIFSGLYRERYSFIHIGKTAGNTVKSIASDVNHNYNKKLHIYPHNCDLKNILRFRKDRISFILRDPAERFISGFYSRMRNGRPLNNRLWSLKEAISYLYFPDANKLCEALGDDDERLYSAALYAINSIQHLKRGYSFYFQSVDMIKKYEDRFYAIVPFDKLHDYMHEIFSPLGVPQDFVEKNMQKYHAAPVETARRTAELTQAARENLRSFLQQDYEIYEYLKLCSSRKLCELG